MSNTLSEIDAAIRSAKRLVLISRLNLIAALGFILLASAAALSIGTRLYKSMGGGIETACLLGALVGALAAGAWVRLRHGPKVFWPTILGVALFLWGWAKYQVW